MPVPDEFERTAVHQLPPTAPQGVAPGPPYPPAPGYPQHQYPYPWPPPAPRRTRRWPAVAALVVTVAATTLLVAALLSDRRPGGDAATATDVTAPAPTTTAPPDTVPEPAAGTSPERPAPLGTPLSPAKGWTMRLTHVDLDADEEMAAGSFLARPGSGKQFVLVTMELTYQGTQPAVPLSQVKVTLVAPGGAAHGYSLSPTPDRIDALSEVPPGGSLHGNVAFEVPRAEVSRLVLRAEPLFTLTRNADQRYFALR